MAPVGLGAQRIITWEQFESCKSCQLVPREILRLGDEEGPGAIESEDVRVVGTRGRGYLLWSEVAGKKLGLFDERGVFVREIGQPGEGPGELSYIEAAAFLEEDGIVVLDQNSRLTTFSDSGEHLRSVPVQGVHTSRAFQLTEGDSAAVVGRFGSRPESVGYPLHGVDLRSGEVTVHFGSSEPASWSVSEPQARVVLLGRVERLANNVWWGKKSRPHIEQWSLDGTQLLTITGELDWFPGGVGRRPRGSPWGSVTDFSVDGEDRLWIVTWVPDPNWRQLERRGSEGGITLEQAPRYWDGRLDVFDLSQMRHLGSYTWDLPWVKLMQKEGRVSVSLVEYQRPTWPRAFLYRVDVRAPPSKEVFSPGRGPV